MKKKLFTMFTAIILLGGVTCAQAQTIDDIRKAYADVKEYIAMMSENFPSDGIPAEFYHLHVALNLPATGPHFEDIRMYFGEKEHHDMIYAPHYLRFLTTKYNFAVREYYEEYLFNGKGQLMFVYGVNPDVVFGELYEFRLYFNDQQLQKAIVKKKAVDEKEYQEVYNGPKLPEAFAEPANIYRAKAKTYLTFFKNVEDVVYPYSE